MPLVKAECTNCGGILDVDNRIEAAICPSCNSPYIVEKAIQQFNIQNTNYIQNAVFYKGEETEDELLKRGIKQIELEIWKDASETFRRMTRLYPANYKGWIGMWICSANYVCEVDVETCKKSAIRQCPAEIKADLKKANVQFTGSIRCYTYNIDKCNEELSWREVKIESINKEIEDGEHELKIIAKNKKMGLIFTGLAILFLFINVLLALLIDVVAVHFFLSTDVKDNSGKCRDVPKEMAEKKAMLECLLAESNEWYMNRERYKKNLEFQQNLEPVEYFVDLIRG